MGMFDYVLCEHPLPDGWDCAGVEFQTKDTDAQRLEKYVIRPDGSLWREVPDGWQRVPFHGALEFYTGNVCMSGPGGFATENDEPPFWAAYVAHYDHGQLVRIEGEHRLEDTKDWKTRDELHRLWQEKPSPGAAQEGKR